jgi:hypothetical protein
LPLCKNYYNAVDPLWAHFVTVMHVVMALFCIADVVAPNVRIFGAEMERPTTKHAMSPSPAPQ